MDKMVKSYVILKISRLIKDFETSEGLLLILHYTQYLDKVLLDMFDSATIVTVAIWHCPTNLDLNDY